VNQATTAQRLGIIWQMMVIAWLRTWIPVALSVAVLLAAAIAFVDALRMPARSFEGTGRLVKKHWLLILGAGLLFAVLGGLGIVGIMLNLIAIAPAAAYWYGLRDEIKPYRNLARRDNRRPSNIRRVGNPFSGSASTRRGSISPATANRKGTRTGWSGSAKTSNNRLSPLDSRAAGNPNDPRFDV